MKKTCKIIMLPTDEYSKTGMLVIREHDNKLIRHTDLIEFHGKNQHLYLVSDEKIKEGDWVYWTDPEGLTSDINQVVSVDEEMIFISHPEHSETEALPHECRKVIATTDKSLIECDGCKRAKNSGTIYTCSCGCSTIKLIPESFIKYFVEKNGKVDEVEVEYNEGRPKENAINFNDWNPFPKLTDNNEVIIHLPEEKMYSREEVKKLIINSFEAGYQSRVQESTGQNVFDVDDFIKENL